MAVLSSLVFSFILRLSSIQESSLQYLITGASFITLFAGGFISGSKGRKKGWFLGGATGLIYSTIIFLFQFLGFDSLFSFEQIIYHICYFLTCMMGGILGVNIASSKTRNV